MEFASFVHCYILNVQNRVCFVAGAYLFVELMNGKARISGQLCPWCWFLLKDTGNMVVVISTTLRGPTSVGLELARTVSMNSGVYCPARVAGLVFAVCLRAR